VADKRLELGTGWVKSQLGNNCIVQSLAGDASFRRYFRVLQGSKSFVLMDASPDKEDVTPFLAVRNWLAGANVRVPELIFEDREQGFLLLEDFADVTWALHLTSGNMEDITLDDLFEDALTQLKSLQLSTPTTSLPSFDVERMQRECNLYLDWYLPKVAAYVPTDMERKTFHSAMLPLLEELDLLPKTPVHLDYHSRNLMLPDGQLPLGIIDFQDAVVGPVTYDLASLLYDCYQNYPEDVRCKQSRLFFEGLSENVAAAFEGFETWHRAVRLTAMQRHIKAIGIFARLAYRDGKLQFLDEIPLTCFHLQEEMQALGLMGSEFALLKIASD
jgi:aminoglycoside/choline kinase family phosphotransferase